MPETIALLIYPDVAELDFIGPKDIFYASKWLRKSDERIITVAADLNPVTCFGGTQVLPDATFETCGPVDILLVPGTADPLAQTDNRPLLDWVEKSSAGCRWVTSVCTGSAILLAAGVGRGKTVTTHPQAIEPLRRLKAATVLDNVRYVRDGNLVTKCRSQRRDRHDPLTARPDPRPRTRQGGAGRARLLSRTTLCGSGLTPGINHPLESLIPRFR